MPQHDRHRDAAEVQVGDGRGVAAGQRRELVVERGERRVAAEHRLAAEAVEQVRAPLAEVHDPRREPLGVQAQPHDVHGRLEQVRGHAVGEEADGAVGGHEPPVAIDDERRVGLVAAEDPVERVAHGPHLRLVEPALRERGRVAGREQQRVALAQRHLELLGEPQHHLGARARAARLDEAEVPRRHARLQREVELA